MNQRATSLVTQIRDYLLQEEIDAFLIGGYLRDVLLGRDTRDIDFVLAADATVVAHQLSDALRGAFVLLDEEIGIARVVLKKDDTQQWYLDFSTLCKDISTDLGRRDFTINAMAVNLRDIEEGDLFTHIIDPFGGQEDIRGCCLRAVSTGVFEDDPIRLLRAVRLAAELGFTIEEMTESQIRSQHYLLQGVSAERVREEVCRLMSIPGSVRWVRYLDSLGLLMEVIPELLPSKGVEQPGEHYWDVFEHSVETVSAVEGLLLRERGTLPIEVISCAPWSAEIAEHFESYVGGLQRYVLIKLAALLHDVAKPQTKIATDDGRVHFFGHTTEGAAIAGNLLHRLRFSSLQIKMVQRLIEQHLRMWQMSNEGLPTRRAIYRFFRDCGDESLDVIFLSLADYLATQGPNLKLEEWQKHISLAEYLLERSHEEQSIVSPPKLIDGHDLINIFGLKPGPYIGKLLQEVRESQGGGEIATREEALDFLRLRLALKEIPGG